MIDHFESQTLVRRIENRTEIQPAANDQTGVVVEGASSRGTIGNDIKFCTQHRGESVNQLNLQESTKRSTS